ncbi:MAG: TetR/AcrR family transcriptional regulator [Nitriliruptorales bacterium]|nr:TetR/AcrR family transcriptional regulator [Nitriliruptorales bacterium]
MPTEATSRTLRDEQLEVTRNRVLDAVAELIASDGVFDFTVQQVADRAGVSHRTIYRHFPDRTALLDALSGRLDVIMTDQLGVPSMASEEFDPVKGIDATWRLFEDQATLMEALVIASVGTGASLPVRRRRTEDLRANIQDALDHLDPATAEAVMAVIRTLGSSTTWFAVRRDHDVDMQEARRATVWAMATLLADLRAGGGPVTTTSDQSSEGDSR